MPKVFITIHETYPDFNHERAPEVLDGADMAGTLCEVDEDTVARWDAVAVLYAQIQEEMEDALQESRQEETERLRAALERGPVTLEPYLRIPFPEDRSCIGMTIYKGDPPEQIGYVSREHPDILLRDLPPGTSNVRLYVASKINDATLKWAVRTD